MGIEDVCKTGIARIPHHMYQKLELGKVVATTFGSRKSLEVIMIDSTKDVIMLDKQMCKAITGGLQMNSFTMPSLKMNDQRATFQGMGNSDSSNGSSKPSIKFISGSAPKPSLLTKPVGDVIEMEIQKQDKANESDNKDDNEPLTGGLALLKMQAELQMKLEAEQGTGEIFYDGDEDENKDGSKITSDEIPALGSKFKQYIDDPLDMEAAEERKKKVSDLAAIMEANMAKSSQERWDATEGFQNRKSFFSKKETKDGDDHFNDGGFERGMLRSSDPDTIRKEVEQEIIINHGTNIARALAALPPNVLHPVSYANAIKVNHLYL